MCFNFLRSRRSLTLEGNQRREWGSGAEGLQKGQWETVTRKRGSERAGEVPDDQGFTLGNVK